MSAVVIGSVIIIILLIVFQIFTIRRVAGYKRRTFEIARALFGLLQAERPEIAASGIHVYLLTACFFDYLPINLKLKINDEELKYGALLHDIGKLAVPEEILNKAGKLEKKEMLLVRSHTDKSEMMLSGIGGLENVAKWVKYHHERIDGKGYYSLKGDQIPLEARIIAIADTYSSIILGGSYKPTGTTEDALTVLRMDSGTQFDEELVDYFSHIPANRLNEAEEELDKIMRKVTDIRL